MTQKIYKKTLKMLLATLMCGHIISDTYSDAFNTAIANPAANVNTLESALSSLTSATKDFDDAVIDQYFTMPSGTADLQALFDVTTGSADGIKARNFINDAIKWIFPSTSPVVLTQSGVAPTQPDVSYTAFTSANASVIDDWYTNNAIPVDFANAVRAQLFVNPSDLQSLQQTLQNDDTTGGDQLTNDGQITSGIDAALAAGIDLNTYMPGGGTPGGGGNPTLATEYQTFLLSLNKQGAPYINDFFAARTDIPAELHDAVKKLYDNKYVEDGITKPDSKDDLQDVFDMMGLAKFNRGTIARTAINNVLTPISLKLSMTLADLIPVSSNNDNVEKIASFFEPGNRVPASFDDFVLEKAEDEFADLNLLVQKLMELHGLSNTNITAAKTAAEHIVKVINQKYNYPEELSIELFLGLESKDVQEMKKRMEQVLFNKKKMTAFKESLTKHADLIKIFAYGLDLQKHGDEFTRAVDKMDGIAWDRIEQLSNHTISQSSIPILHIYFYLYGALLDLPAFDVAKRTTGFEDFYSEQSPVFTAQFNIAKAAALPISASSKTEKGKLELERDIDLRNKVATEQIEDLVEETNSSMHAFLTKEEKEELLHDFYKQLYNIVLLAIQKEQPAGHMKQIIEKYLSSQYEELKKLKGVTGVKDTFEKAWSNAQVSKLFDLLKLDTKLLEKVRLISPVPPSSINSLPIPPSKDIKSFGS